MKRLGAGCASSLASPARPDAAVNGDHGDVYWPGRGSRTSETGEAVQTSQKRREGNEEGKKGQERLPRNVMEVRILTWLEAAGQLWLLGRNGFAAGTWGKTRGRQQKQARIQRGWAQEQSGEDERKCSKRRRKRSSATHWPICGAYNTRASPPLHCLHRMYALRHRRTDGPDALRLCVTLTCTCPRLRSAWGWAPSAFSRGRDTGTAQAGGDDVPPWA